VKLQNIKYFKICWLFRGIYQYSWPSFHCAYAETAIYELPANFWHRW